MDIEKSSRGRVNGAPNPVDVYVGNRVRIRRTLLGMSQEKLGEELGLTFQQVQKYERGLNRIGASRLWDLCNVLNSPIGYFYEGIDKAVASFSPRNVSKGDFAAAAEEGLPEEDNDPLTRRETLEMVRAYYRIEDRAVAKKIFELIKTVAGKEESLPEESEEGVAPEGTPVE